MGICVGVSGSPLRTQLVGGCKPTPCSPGEQSTALWPGAAATPSAVVTGPPGTAISGWLGDQTAINHQHPCRNPSPQGRPHPGVGETPGVNPALFVGDDSLLLKWPLLGGSWEPGFLDTEPRS